MKIWIESPYKIAEIRKRIEKSGAKIGKNPDFVITYGGDGTILLAEHRYPGVPKIPVQKSRICSKCFSYSVDDLEKTIAKIKTGAFRVKEKTKIEAKFKNRKITALNEVQIRSKDPRRAVRMEIKHGKKKTNIMKTNIIGDGLVAATPYGSTGYYRSLGYKPFASGIRIGFNNVWPKRAALHGGIVATLTREEAFLAADNFFLKTIKAGDSVTIQESKEKARFVVV